VLLSSCILIFALPALPAQILVAAASDLAPLERPLAAAFHSATSHSLRFTLGSSGMLARQIRYGAPYDVYLSANEQYVEELADSGHLLEDSRRVYARGRLALWSPQGSIGSLRDLLSPPVRHVAMANPAHAPYGVAARQALEHQRLWETLQPKIVFAENVRQAFQYAESGNADAVITSWTLLFDKGGILLPEQWHAPILQAGGVLKSSKQPALARRFLDFLTSPQGRAILLQYGLQDSRQ